MATEVLSIPKFNLEDIANGLNETVIMDKLSERNVTMNILTTRFQTLCENIKTQQKISQKQNDKFHSYNLRYSRSRQTKKQKITLMKLLKQYIVLLKKMILMLDEVDTTYKCIMTLNARYFDVINFIMKNNLIININNNRSYLINTILTVKDECFSISYHYLKLKKLNNDLSQLMHRILNKQKERLFILYKNF